MSEKEIELWQWQYTDARGKRVTTRYLMTEENARACLLDPVKVPDSREIRKSPADTCK